MCLAGVQAGPGVEYLTGLGLGVSGHSGTRCLQFCSDDGSWSLLCNCLALPVFFFKTTPCHSFLPLNS